MKNNRITCVSRWKTFLFLAPLCCLPLLAHASAIGQFRHFLSGTRSARGTFAQVQVRQEKSEKMRMGTPSSGTFLFSKPGKFIWTYQKPYEQTLQADGTMLYIYDKDLNQVSMKKLGKALGASPAAILFGSTDIEKDFTLSEKGERDGMEWMEAKPKNHESTFQSINIGMKENTPVALELHDAMGQLSLIRFTKFEKNPPLKPDTFRFVMPKGADIFKN
ncbi:MAG: outer membrane lipoprotein chaperone LolA [Oxalobacter formigenes]|nr:outer membrane lipoprotein chaperone LolA [Oxalobacter formigenes]